MSLRDEGFRFLVYVGDFVRSAWIHPAEVAQLIAAGWVDATEMNDDEYDAFIESAHR